jgi:hypothetical protein
MIYQQWGAGYLAGSSIHGRHRARADLETYTAWLDKWCADDPSSGVLAGIDALLKRLSSSR